MMERLKLVELEAVLAIDRKGSFRAAALELGISTTSLSNTVASLERRLGVRVFNRTTRSVSPTDAGREFVAQLRPAMQSIHDAVEAARSQQDTPSGMLRINAFPNAAREVFEPLILEFARRYPQVHVDLATEGKLVDIVADGFDFGIRRADLVPSDMIAVPLGKPRGHAVVASPGYLATAPTLRVPTDLLHHPCIRVRLPNGALLRWGFEKDGELLHLDPNGPLTLDEASLVRAAVVGGMGVGYLMESDVAEDVAAGRMIRLLTDWTPPIAPLSLYYSGRRNASAAFRAFVEAARRHAARRSKA
jgi:DNA-binding transcriptional LysR family regulator